MRLALIGTGRMGTPIAARLRAAGHRLVVHDAAPEARERMAAEGFEVAADAPAATRDAEAVLLCLPDAAAVSAIARACTWRTSSSGSAASRRSSTSRC